VTEKRRQLNFKHLCQKYPDINPVEGENLDIPTMRINILKKCWYDKSRFKSVTSIAKVTGISEREILRTASDEKFTQRRDIKTVKL
jgi:hypothetical protein